MLKLACVGWQRACGAFYSRINLQYLFLFLYSLCEETKLLVTKTKVC